MLADHPARGFGTRARCACRGGTRRGLHREGDAGSITRARACGSRAGSCLPTYARGQADQQHFFLNGRPLRDKLVASAVRLAYRDVLFHGRQPAYVLYLEIDPSRVDVNAHPQKLEVRFREPGLIHDFLFRTLERALARDPRLDRGGARRSRRRVCGLAARNAAGADRLRRHWICTGLDPGSVREPAATTASESARRRCRRSSGRRGEATPRDHPLGYAIAQLHGVYILAQAPRRTGARRHARRARAHGVRAAQAAPAGGSRGRASRCCPGHGCRRHRRRRRGRNTSRSCSAGSVWTSHAPDRRSSLVRALPALLSSRGASRAGPGPPRRPRRARAGRAASACARAHARHDGLPPGRARQSPTRACPR